MSSAARVGLLSVHNAPYVQLVKNLGRKGVLRLGGDVSSFSRYEPQAQVMTEPKNTIVTQGSLEQLSAFLRAVGWTALGASTLVREHCRKPSRRRAPWHRS